MHSIEAVAFYKNVDETLRKYMVDKKTRREYFAPEGGIDSLLRSMSLAYEKDFDKVNPWTITVGQLDQDEAIEFFVGAYRPTSYYSNNTRPYFLEYKDGVFVRQWTGSYLDHLCFTEASFVDPEMVGISVLRLEEYVMRKGRVERQTGEFTIYGFQPIRLSPKKDR